MRGERSVRGASRHHVIIPAMTYFLRLKFLLSIDPGSQPFSYMYNHAHAVYTYSALLCLSYLTCGVLFIPWVAAKRHFPHRNTRRSLALQRTDGRGLGKISVCPELTYLKDNFFPGHTIVSRLRACRVLMLGDCLRIAFNLSRLASS